MKKLIVILGPNGVGKTTADKAFLDQYKNCAYVDADWCRAINPFPPTPATKMAVTENIYCMFKNYLLCGDIDKIVFPYPSITTTELSPKEVARQIADIID